jgi:hypothetical protein
MSHEFSQITCRLIKSKYSISSHKPLEIDKKVYGIFKEWVNPLRLMEVPDSFIHLVIYRKATN